MSSSDLNNVLDSVLTLRLCDFMKLNSTLELTSKLCDEFRIALDFQSMSDECFDECRGIISSYCRNLDDLQTMLRLMTMLAVKQRYNSNVGVDGDVIDGI